MDKNKRRANILFLMADQYRWDALGLLNSRVKTPNLDKLASDGILFTNAVCNSPMCVPSRYSMMTGLYPSQCGVRHNTQMCPTDDDMVIKTLAQRMYQLGYQTAGIGKTHWYIIQPGDKKAEVKTSTRGFEIEVGGRKNTGFEKAGSNTEYMYDELPEVFEVFKKEHKNYRIGGENAEGYIGCTSEIPPEKQKEGWFTKKAIDFLENRRDPDRPFFLYLSFDFPHAGLNVPKGYEQLYNLEDFRVPVLETEQAQLTDHYVQPKNVKEWRRWREEFSEEDKKRTIMRYYALCTYVDDMFGKVINKLKETGEYDNTFIIFTSDHGDMLGERNRFSKYSLYEGSVRVPVIISGACIDNGLKASKDDRCAELADVLPTLIQVGGGVRDERLAGYSLLEQQCRTGSFSELHGSGYQEVERPPAYMWRKKDWKLILYIPGYFKNLDMRLDEVKGELYYIKGDPLELNNLYDKAEYLKLREKMTRELLMHMAVAWSRFPRMYSYTGLK